MSSVLRMDRLAEVPDAAASILHTFADRRVFALHGDLGAGKTTLIKALCTELDVVDAMSSPTFALVNEYQTGLRGKVYHFDLYRMKTAAELDGIGFVEYLDSGAYCFVEWPELAANLLPPDAVHLSLRATDDGARTITFELADQPLPSQGIHTEAAPGTAANIE
jgi:tRNA threonylcarbamoyladenosine biosynthesis protein TsaE